MEHYYFIIKKNKQLLYKELNDFLGNKNYYNEIISNALLNHNNITDYLSSYKNKADYWYKGTDDAIFKEIIELLSFKNN